MNGSKSKQIFLKWFRFPEMDFGAKKDKTFDEEFSFYSELLFHELLCVERKRTERSQKPILLVMLNIKKLLDVISKYDVIKSISSFLTTSTREIDIKGWYKYNQSIGIIYTELNGSGKEPIVKKIHENLMRTCGQENAAKIEVTYAVFPREGSEGGADPDNITDNFFYPFPLAQTLEKKASFLLKRAVDIIGSSFLILMLLPLFILIATLIKLNSKGAVFFTQTRLGLKGKPFKIIKFRSMYSNNDSFIHREYVKKLILGPQENGGAENNRIFKISDDPRVTAIGKFIRKTSLDELPQFFNVLFGDMSLVGPRPPIPYEIENYKYWHLRRVLEIKPGITGYWQVVGRSVTNFDTMVRMDLQYIRRWSIWWDLKLIISTPFVIFKGAY